MPLVCWFYGKVHGGDPRVLFAFDNSNLLWLSPFGYPDFAKALSFPIGPLDSNADNPSVILVDVAADDDL